MKKTNVYLLILFIFLSIANLLIVDGNYPISSFLVGESIIFLLIRDFSKSTYQFHIYQVMLLYFYFTLVISHNYNPLALDKEYYLYGYIVVFINFICFVVGYNTVEYKNVKVVIRPKQNYYYMLYLLVSLTFLLFTTISLETEKYSDRFTLQGISAGPDVMSGILGTVRGYLILMLAFFINHPVILGGYLWIESLMLYVHGGVKGDVIRTAAFMVMAYQIYYKKIKVSHLTLLLPVAIIMVLVLIGTTSFRSDLTPSSLLTSLEFEKMQIFLEYFVRSPEANHIIYTSDIVERIDNNSIDFRYGFDYVRLLLYPVKSFFSDFEYASYVEYAHILSGREIYQGFYLGLAGELYWNFGFLFFVFSFLYGFMLKKFTNWGFSGFIIPSLSYLIMYKTILWQLYRGETNNFIFNVAAYMTSLLCVLLFIRGVKAMSNKVNNSYIIFWFKYIFKGVYYIRRR